MSNVYDLTAPAFSRRRGGRQASRAVRAFRRDRLGLIGLVILAFLVGCALWPVALMPHDPLRGELPQRFLPPSWLPNGNPAFLLGTDQLGRDMVSRLLLGARFSLFITLTAVPISTVLGVILGLLAGYFGGRTDSIIMRLVDVQLAFPLVLLVIGMVAVLGPSLPNLIAVLAFAGWARYARTIRGSTLSVRAMDFIEAGRAIGAGHRRLILHHILPNVLSPIVVLSTFELARLLLLESTLSFLGVGVQPPAASWGSMIADGRNNLYEAWWVSAFPGLMIAAAVMAFNFVGDALRDALDPRLQID